MADLKTFRNRVSYYLRHAEIMPGEKSRVTQADLAAKVHYSREEFSRILNGKSTIPEGFMHSVVSALADWGAIKSEGQARYLLNLMNAPDFNPEDWKAEPLVWLKDDTNQPEPSIRPKIPHNLPPRGEFVGREKEMKEVLEILSSVRYPLLSIEGMGGIGKTTLAVEAAYNCLPSNDAKIEDPFEAIVWISAKDRPEQKHWFNEVLDTVARVLGYHAVIQMPQEQKIMEIDQLLRTHHTLIIVDNFETIEDSGLVKWIQRHAPEPSKVLITFRYSQIRKAYDIQLEGLEVFEALELIYNYTHRFKWQSVEDTEDKWRSLVQVTEGNPTAIEMALGYMKRGRLSLDEVVEHLSTASQSVDELFGDLYARLWQEILTKDAKQILLVLPFFADFASKEALGAVTGLTGHHLDYALEELVELALLKVNEKQVTSNLHYSTHPLTRAFASSKLREVIEFEEQARLRWYNYYLDFATRRLVIPMSQERYWNTLGSPGFKLIDPEWPNIQNVLIWVEQKEQDLLLIELTILLVHYMHSGFQNVKRIHHVQRAVIAAHKLGLKEDEALLRMDALGWVLLDQGRFAEAEYEITMGLQIAESLGNENPHATELVTLAKTFLARVFLEQDQSEKASSWMSDIDLTHCGPLIQRRVYFISGDIAYKKKNYLEAIQHYEKAIQVSHVYDKDEKGFESLRPYNHLGLAYLANGNLEQAEVLFNKIIVTIKHFGITFEVVYAKYGLSKVAIAKGEREKAIKLAQEAKEDLFRLVTSHQFLKEIDDLLKELEEDKTV